MKHHLHRIKTWYRNNSNPPYRDNEKWIEEQAKESLEAIQQEVSHLHPNVPRIVRGRIIAHKISEWF